LSLPNYGEEPLSLLNMRSSKSWRKTPYSDPNRKNLHFDLLIALTVRTADARLIASNRTGFELIKGYRDFHLEVW